VAANTVQVTLDDLRYLSLAVFRRAVIKPSHEAFVNLAVRPESLFATLTRLAGAIALTRIPPKANGVVSCPPGIR
jgi:hypothetical protein